MEATGSFLQIPCCAESMWAGWSESRDWERGGGCLELPTCLLLTLKMLLNNTKLTSWLWIRVHVGLICRRHYKTICDSKRSLLMRLTGEWWSSKVGAFFNTPKWTFFFLLLKVTGPNLSSYNIRLESIPVLLWFEIFQQRYIVTHQFYLLCQVSTLLWPDAFWCTETEYWH